MTGTNTSSSVRARRGKAASSQPPLRKQDDEALPEAAAARKAELAERLRKKRAAGRKLVTYLSCLVIILAATALALTFKSSSGPSPSPSRPDSPTPSPLSVGADADPAVRVFSQAELAAGDGSDPDAPLLLGILGRVYDVSTGARHYAKDGAYSFFTGRDGSAAFVTGDFTTAGLTDDLTGLSDDDIMGIAEWLDTYERQYVRVGVVEGAFYTATGMPTPALTHDVAAAVARAAAAKAAEQDLRTRFPGCNIRRSAGQKGEIWCENMSGGINRDYVGVIRQFYDKVSGSKRCVCVRNDLLDDPRLQLYPSCPDQATHCWID
ncbi:cytochrome b5 domain-containing protein 2, partial [Thecamonas trahens ATCC 50062]